MSLPSIREMFPGLCPLSLPTPHTHPSPTDYHAPPQQILHSPSPTHIMPSPTRPTQHLPVSRASPTFAFTVLRTDPHTCSLEHIASSTSLRPRLSLHSPYHHISHHIANGSHPAFRVAVPPPVPSPASTPPSAQPPHRAHSRRPALDDAALPANLVHKPNPRSVSSSSIISFSLADPPGRASTITSSDGRRTRSHHHFSSANTVVDGIRIVDSDRRDARDGRGKKHQCPHCSKRFNRPSSLKIHVNTHTGAKPYPCPFPGCGREFNVNSNMRRHWRNHSRNGASQNGSIGATARPASLHSLSLASPLPQSASSANLSPASNPSSLSSPSSSALSSFSPASSATSLPSALSSPGAKHMHLHPNSTLYARHPNRGNPAVLVSPPLSNLSISSPQHRDDDDMTDGGDSEGMDVDDPSEEDELEDESEDDGASSRAHHHRERLSSAHGFASESNVRASRHSPYPHSSSPYAHARASLAHSSPTHQLYRPSIPAYARSCTDERVSTALRPAFAGRA
ncbi:hypothetical protein SERLA73DRAFT_79694 [Serpula lacrymans var. lacrymans S7.3]|uniref:C2H2-type domain-containing protein n=2 Tax=Serpula lacrymans var. lacrymans TaxID=341189 RepID=F8QH93_SERL3|nr:hypothetical protein SERLA73DRAFT_79694 [Serpula lacrymans var. lacrymans S7.3]